MDTITILSIVYLFGYSCFFYSIYETLSHKEHGSSDQIVNLVSAFILSIVWPWFITTGIMRMVIRQEK